LVELVSYIKNIGSMMQRCDTLVADALWETIHAEVQDFVQNTLATMLRTTFRKKKDLSRWGFEFVINDHLLKFINLPTF
jgi:cytoplasmic FMR1 interacting protein